MFFSSCFWGASRKVEEIWWSQSSKYFVFFVLYRIFSMSYTCDQRGCVVVCGLSDRQAEHPFVSRRTSYQVLWHTLSNNPRSREGIARAYLYYMQHVLLLLLQGASRTKVQEIWSSQQSSKFFISLCVISSPCLTLALSEAVSLSRSSHRQAAHQYRRTLYPPCTYVQGFQICT